jgi:hypothetical protein
MPSEVLSSKFEHGNDESGNYCNSREISSFATSNEWEFVQVSGEFCNVCAAIEGILRVLREFVHY